MTKDEQARARLVEIALRVANYVEHQDQDAFATGVEQEIGLSTADIVRKRAGFKNPRTGSWCAAGLTAAMEDAGLVVPAPGTPARRGAVALLDWQCGESWKASLGQPNGTNGPGYWRFHPLYKDMPGWPAPGDIIAWLQHLPGKDPAGWRRGHVALIVAVDDESITTVGWNEGPSPGAVQKRMLHCDIHWPCERCNGAGSVRPTRAICKVCKGRRCVPRSSTVLYRRPGGIYGIARPIAR